MGSGRALITADMKEVSPVLAPTPAATGMRMIAHTPAVAATVRWTFLGAAILLAAWLLSPMLNPVHPEGFTAGVGSLALHLNRDSLANFDALQPLNTEYFTLTKLGWVLATALLTGMLHLSTTNALTALTWASAAAFSAGTWFLVRKWTRAPTPLILAGLVFLPGVSESAFFFNDNLLASTWAVLGLCALYARRALTGAVLCGALFAFAVLSRTDTVLVAVAVPVILLERFGRSAKTTVALALAGTTGGAVLLGTLALFHASIFDVLEAGLAAANTWDGMRAGERTVPLLIFFMGLPGVILAGCGLYAVVERRAWSECAHLLIAPAVFLFVLWSKIWVERHFLPLTPFLVSLAVIGFRGMFAGESTRSRAVLHGVMLGLIGFSLFGPVAVPAMIDGPRSLTGRVANIERWRQWQAEVGRDLALLDKVIFAEPAGTKRAMLADAWNEDRYLHLKLQEAGYSIKPAREPECSPIAERFVRGRSEVYLVRLFQGYVPYWRQLSGGRLEKWGRPCLEKLGVTDITFVAANDRAGRLLGPVAKQYGPHKTAQLAYEPLRAIRLDEAGLSALLQGYKREARELALGGEATGTVEQGVEATRRRTGFRP